MSIKFNDKALKLLLVEKGLTQSEFAKKLGMSSSGFSKYMNGTVTPPLDVLDKMCLMLQIPLTKLIVDNDGNNNALQSDNDFAFDELIRHVSFIACRAVADCGIDTKTQNIVLQAIKKSIADAPELRSESEFQRLCGYYICDDFPCFVVGNFKTMEDFSSSENKDGVYIIDIDGKSLEITIKDGKVIDSKPYKKHYS